MNRSFRAEVAGNVSLSQTHCIIRIAPESPHFTPVPGQFYLLRSSTTLDPLLRRPFSILRWDDRCLEFLVRVKGKGTRLLKDLRPGDCIEALGPLGRGYPRPSVDETPVIVAGGVGIASVYPLIERLGTRAHVFYGARGSGDLHLLGEIEALTDKVETATDDGSTGFRGSAVERLGEMLERIPARPVVYACGPEGMTAALLALLKERGVSGHVSLEERMACGVGACLGCVVRTRAGYRRVCKEGPVFGTDELR